MLDQHQLLVVLEEFGVAPLLEFHHHVRVLARAAVQPGQHHVGPLAGERQLVLDEHLYLAQPRLDEIGGEYGQAALPGPAFGRGGDDTSGHAQMLSQHLAEVLLNWRGECPGSPTEDRHRPTPNTARLLVRMGAYPRPADQLAGGSPSDRIT